MASNTSLLRPSAEEGGASRGKQSRSEKKSRKAMQKLGMKPVPNITRVTIKKSKNVRLLYIPLDELAGAKGCTCNPTFKVSMESDKT